MKSSKPYCTPVQYQSAYTVIFPYHNIFNGNQVEYLGPSLYCLKTYRGRGFYGIRSMVAFLAFYTPDAELINDFDSFVLYDNSIEHHSPTWHATPRPQASLKNNRPYTCLCQIVGSSHPCWASASNSYFDIHRPLEFLKETAGNNLRYLSIIELHLFLLNYTGKWLALF